MDKISQWMLLMHFRKKKNRDDLNFDWAPLDYLQLETSALSYMHVHIVGGLQWVAITWDKLLFSFPS